MRVERELLFGILAFQNGCLSRESLLSGLKIWKQDRSRPLVEVLREQGTLSNDAADLLGRLVDLHVQQHGNDPQQSLGSLSSLGSLRQELDQLDDAEIAATLTHLPATPDAAAAETVIPSQSDSQQTFVPSESTRTGDIANLRPSGSRYRIIKPHAKGGLGEVFVARDEELNRDVALKEIRGEHADNKDSRGRFVLEAEITGGLEHPGIVPVYGLGQYADGRPYYAMRFIQGDSLKEAISAFHSEQDANPSDSERTLQLRKLFGRFIDVCQAISYAHSRGVLHRDLKPGNIMLGKYGETLVVDWGLAKVKGREEVGSAEAEQSLRPLSSEGITPTMMGSALGTPAYMPPEQAAGKLDELGPASDVYSLGATLYHLLTGKTPFQDDTIETLLKNVQSGTFPRPTEVNANVPKSLEAVCLKAMALKPRDRYVTPQELADDIERFLADEPVQAFPEPFSVRAKRWVRKHPTLTTTTAAVVLLSAVGLGTFSTILGAKNTQLSGLNDQLGDRNTELADKNVELDQANQDLTAANVREHEARTLAETNEQSARQQSQLALQTLTSVIFDVQRSFENLPGGGQVRRRLLTTSLEKLNQVATEYVEQTTVDHNTIVALMDMGDVVLKFGVGDYDGQPSLEEGAFEARLVESQPSAVGLAKLFYTRAHELATGLVSADPTNSKAQWSLVVSYAKLGEVQLRLGNTQQAVEYFEQFNERCENYAGENPMNTEAQQGLSLSYEKLGDVSSRLGDSTEALAYYGQSRDIRESLVAADLNRGTARRELAVSYDKLGDVSLEMGSPLEAIEFYQQAFDIRENLAAIDPADTQSQRDLCISYDKLGDASLALNDAPEAARHYREFNTICERLVEADPANAQAQWSLLVSYSKLGDLSLQLGDAQQALLYYEQLRECGEQLVEEDSTNAQAQEALLASYGKLGGVYLQLGDTALALDFYQQCHKLCVIIASSDSANAYAQRNLSISLDQLGDMSLRLGNASEAVAHYQRSLDIREELAEDDPASARAQRDLMVSHYKLGEAHASAMDNDASVDHFRIAIGILEELIANGIGGEQSLQELQLLQNRQTAVQFEAELEAVDRLAERGDWSGAAEICRDLARNSSDPWLLARWAVLTLMLEDLEGYREACLRIEAITESQDDWVRSDLVLILELHNESGIGSDRLATFTQFEADNARFQVAMRLADLRSGDDESAATAGQIPGDVYQRSLAKFTAAIALARLGRREDATAMLATATRIFEENVPDPAGPKLAAYHPERWIVWCQLELMRREAQAALEGVDGE